jgi:glutamine synthetase
MLKAGLDGIKNKIEPPQEIVENIYEMTPERMKDLGVESLAANIKEAVDLLQTDAVIKSALGEHILKHFVNAKNIEWDLYKSQVHDWELKQYLTTF